MPVSQIVNHISSSLTALLIERLKILYNYRRHKQEESNIATSNSDTSFHLKRDARYKYYQRKSKNFLYKVKNNCEDKNVWKLSIPSTRRQYSKCNIQESSKKKCKDISDKISLTPTRILDNSIISMSPNFNTPSHRKRRNVCKTLLTPSNICNDSIVSKSPNFTPVCLKKRNLTKTSSPVDSLKSLFTKSSKYKTQRQYLEFSWYKKHVAQSTPRRKKRSICKIHSDGKRFDSYRYESDVTSDEFISNNVLKPIDLDKTIFFETAEDTTRYDILDTSSELSNLKKHSKIKRQNQYNGHSVVKLDEGRYNENNVTDNKNDINLLNANSSFNQIAKENESINNFSNSKKYVKSENNEINAEFIYITVRRNIFNTDKTLEKSVDTNNIKSTYTTESDSLYKENFVNCVDCDTKKLLNEDLNMNMSKTCNLHAKNWYNDRFYISSSHKSSSSIENDSLSTANLLIRCKKQIYLPDSQESCSSRSIDSKKTESLLKAKDLDMYTVKDNS